MKAFFNNIFNKYKTIKKNIRKKKWLALLLDLLATLIMFAIAGGIGAFIAFGRHAGSVEKTAAEYFELYINHSWEEAYKYLDIKESEFVNKDAFTQMMEGKAVYGEYDNIKAKLKSKKGNVAYVDITYTDMETDEKVTYELKMKKQDKKVYRFFDTWKVDGSIYLVKDFTMEVPEEVDITFDGADIAYSLIETKDDIKKYTIGKLFEGDHTITISTPFIDTVSDAVLVEKDGYVYKKDTRELVMKQDHEQYVQETADKVVFGLYGNALNKLGYEDLKEYFGAGESGEKILSEVYNKLYESINKEDGAMLKSMSVDTYKTYVFTYTYPNKAEVRVDFNCTYEAKTGRTMINGVRGSYEGTASSSVKLFYVYNGEKWIIESTNLTCFDYSPKQEE